MYSRLRTAGAHPGGFASVQNVANFSQISNGSLPFEWFNMTQFAVQIGQQIVLRFAQPEPRLYGLRILLRAVSGVHSQPKRGEHQHSTFSGSERVVRATFYDSTYKMVGAHDLPPGPSVSARGSSAGGQVSMLTIPPVQASSVRLEFLNNALVDEIQVFATRGCASLAGEVLDYSTSADKLQPTTLMAVGEHMYITELQSGHVRRTTLPVLTEVVTLQGQAVNGSGHTVLDPKVKSPPLEYPAQFEAPVALASGTLGSEFLGYTSSQGSLWVVEATNQFRDSKLLKLDVRSLQVVRRCFNSTQSSATGGAFSEGEELHYNYDCKESVWS
eukprot:TRINITY_DN9761_c0_g1_i2.p1 TRINITY_DN9761_c0_g1~~TRINITY_DN9761_c0_g1_i2.p1  ORF type:complete len:329 (+),score=45.44 TRINITY_DN9761_c0_g1_i2:1749-2735(+)